MSDSEAQETTTIKFEWTLKGLKNLFESTKGETKSKVTKSPKFGGGRWQILFYANAGSSKEKEGASDVGYVSLYLSCEPTAAEKEAAISESGRWVREGIFKFNFEIKNLNGTIVGQKDASNHSFSWKTANWGWAQFARRDMVYFQSASARSNNSFVVFCTISSMPSPPAQTPAVPRQFVPKDLVETFGSMLNDPRYSDVEFVITKRGQDPNEARRIYAARQVLKRAEYFETMFNSDFTEASITESMTPKSLRAPSFVESDVLMMSEFDDSDDEDDRSEAGDLIGSALHDSRDSFGALSDTSLADHAMEEDDVEIGDEERNVRAKRSHPSSPRSSTRQSIASPSQEQLSSSPKKPVVVKDFAYSTYFAVLYYIYTDTIVFAPLSSSFIQNTDALSAPQTTSDQPGTSGEPQAAGIAAKRSTLLDPASSRKEWIAEFVRNNPGRPAPCSAKAAYRLAEMMNLKELKERAANHILKSLTVDNIAYEVFSPFAAAFDEIRKAQVDFFLKNWKAIRTSEPMRDVWKQIRHGRHPGFEEVWEVIVSSLEFVSTPPSEDSPMVSGDR